MAGTDVIILLGQFLGSRKPDTADDPFNPSKAFVDVVDPIPGLTLSVPAPVPPEPAPSLSSPAALPIEPFPTLSSPGTLPNEPVPSLSSPGTLPPPPIPLISSPAVLPPQPAPGLSSPATLPNEPAPAPSSPATLPFEPTPPLSSPAMLPSQPTPALSSPVILPVISSTSPNIMSLVDSVVRGFFSIIDQIAGLSPLDAVIDADVARVARTLADLARSSSKNRYGPDIPYVANAVMSIGSLVDDIISGGNRMGVIQDDPLDPTGLKRVAFAIGGTIAPGTLGGTAGATGIVNLFTGDPVRLASPSSWDPKPNLAAEFGEPLKSQKLANSAFVGGVIPADFKRVSKETDQGFVTFKRGAQDSPIDDDDAYMPLAFTDLRPVGQVYRTVYFRPMNVQLAESFAPQWNKAQYFGRVDPVATYQSTGRTLTLSFLMAAFGPEDVQTIWNKLLWLQSMVYPEYDSDLQFYSGPVVRLRVGDVINAIGPEGGRGLPGVIDELSFDYGDAVWELKKNYKVPRNINVSLSFQVLHDMPIGRGAEGRFGGIGTFDTDGSYLPPGRSGKAKPDDKTFFPLNGSDASKLLPDVTWGTAAVRKVGKDNANIYDTLAGTQAPDGTTKE